MHRSKLVLVILGFVLLVAGSAQASTSSNEALAQRLTVYLESKNSPLAPYGRNFVLWGTRYGVDPRFMVAIAGAETSFGTYGPSQEIHNAWGIGPGIDMVTWEHGIKFEAELLGTYYRHKRTIVGVREKWAPGGAANDSNGLNAHWVKNVSAYYKELGGDPNGNVFIVPRGVLPKPSKEVEEYAAAFFLTLPITAGVGDQESQGPNGLLVLIGCTILSIVVLKWSPRRTPSRIKRRRKALPRRK